MVPFVSDENVQVVFEPQNHTMKVISKFNGQIFDSTSYCSWRCNENVQVFIGKYADITIVNIKKFAGGAFHPKWFYIRANSVKKIDLKVVDSRDPGALRITSTGNLIIASLMHQDYVGYYWFNPYTNESLFFKRNCSSQPCFWE